MLKKLPDSPQEGLKSCLGNQLSSNLGKLSFDHYVLRFSHIDHPTIIDFETLVAPQIALFVIFFALNILWMTLATLCTLLCFLLINVPPRPRAPHEGPPLPYYDDDYYYDCYYDYDYDYDSGGIRQ